MFCAATYKPGDEDRGKTYTFRIPANMDVPRAFDYVIVPSSYGHAFTLAQVIEVHDRPPNDFTPKAVEGVFRNPRLKD